jgi:hypothetical protein
VFDYSGTGSDVDSVYETDLAELEENASQSTSRRSLKKIVPSTPARSSQESRISSDMLMIFTPL